MKGDKDWNNHNRFLHRVEVNGLELLEERGSKKLGGRWSPTVLRSKRNALVRVHATDLERV